MQEPIILKIASTIEKYRMIHQNAKVIVAISGGADSVCLLTCLNELKDKYCMELFAVHVNHMLRANASADEQFVSELCSRMNIPLTINRIDVRSEARERGISEELAGRLVRYNCLEEELKRINGGLIATGHNKNDNAETVFMNILRGTGGQGLCGIPPVRGNIIRPLIETERSEIATFLKERGINHQTDETNAQDIYSRNKIRNNIFPYIEQNLSLSLTANLNRLSAIASVDNSFLELEARKHYAKCRTETGIDINVFKNLHPSLKRRILKFLYSDAAGNTTDLEYTHIESMLALCEKKTGKAVSLPGGIIAVRSYDTLHVQKRSCESSGFSYELKIGQALFIKELGKTVEISLYECNNACTKAFNYDIIKGGMEIRSRKNGDKIYLDTIGGHKKLSDYFTDNKIPQDVRDKTALLTCGSNVLWILDDKGITNGKYSAESADKVLYVSVY